MAPDEDGQARVEGVLTSLQALRSALDAERSSGAVAGAPAGMTAEIARGRLHDFRVALHVLRGEY